MRIRIAEPADLVGLEAIEEQADRLLIEWTGASSWPAATSGESRGRQPGFILVADDDGVVGFAHVLRFGPRAAHLEQLSVDPRRMRQGIGRSLVMATLAESAHRRFDRVTLRTFSDVPWNAPFYESCGFRETEPDAVRLRAFVAVEERLGLLDLGRRVQMSADLSAEARSVV